MLIKYLSPRLFLSTLRPKLCTRYSLRKDNTILQNYIQVLRDNKHFLPIRQIPYYVLPLELRMDFQNVNKCHLG